MRLVIDNVATQAIIGGKDNLLKYDLMQKLREYLSVDVEGAFRTPAYKRRQWDGKRYFITDTGKFATGFLPLVAKYMDDLGIQVEVEDVRTNLPYLKKVLDTKVGSWEFRDYQNDLVSKVHNYIMVGGNEIYFPRGIIDAATNAGKSSVIASIHQNTGKVPMLYTIHNSTVYDDIVPFFKGLFDVGEINSKKFEPADFTVAMSKTLFNRAKDSMNVRKELSRYKVLVTDESHTAGSADYSKLLQWIGAGMRVFVSGSALDNHNKINNMIIVGLSGPVIAKVKNAELIKGGWSAEAKVFVHLNDTPTNAFDYFQELEDCIHYSESRVKMIADDILKNGNQQTLISFIELKHGNFMYEYLMDNGIECELASGQDKQKKNKIERFKAGENHVLLSSMILKEGVNIPNIESLWMAQGGKSKITVKQLLGRGLRKFGDKVLKVHEFYDVGKYLSKHSRKRIGILKDEGLEVEYLYEHRRGTPIKKRF